MYDTLLQLPLFQGMCKEDFTTIIERVKFHFLNYAENETVVKQGDNCQQLIFLLDGELLSETADPDYGFKLAEIFRTPFIIEPYSMFGMQTTYTATYKAQSHCKILAIDKSYIFSELNNYEIFRLNFLNILSNRCQMVNRKIWTNHIGHIQEKLAQFLLIRCMKAEGEKKLYITMEDLSKLINETRINVSKLLNDLQKKELLQLKRKEIYIPDLKKLTEELI